MGILYFGLLVAFAGLLTVGVRVLLTSRDVPAWVPFIVWPAVLFAIFAIGMGLANLFSTMAAR